MPVVRPRAGQLDEVVAALDTAPIAPAGAEVDKVTAETRPSDTANPTLHTLPFEPPLRAWIPRNLGARWCPRRNGWCGTTPPSDPAPHGGHPRRVGCWPPTTTPVRRSGRSVAAGPCKDSGVASHTARCTRLGLAIVVAGMCLSACGSTGTSSSDTSTTAPPSGSDVATPGLAGEQSVCAAIDGEFYYPTVPAGGYTLSRATVDDIETRLRQARATGLRADAIPLQRAIEADNEAAMVREILHVQNTTCADSGTPPAT